MSLNEKIEANADLTLWCVHILGPDDVLAAPSHSAAVVHARELNKSLHGRVTTLDDILCFAYAAPWPHSRESHAESVKDWLDKPRGLSAAEAPGAEGVNPTPVPSKGRGPTQAERGRGMTPDKNAMDDAIRAANECHGEGSVARIDEPMTHTKRHEETAWEIARANELPARFSSTECLEIVLLLASALAATEAELVARMMEPGEAMLNAARDWSIKKNGIGVGNDQATGCLCAMLTAFARENSIPIPEKEEADHV